MHDAVVGTKLLKMPARDLNVQIMEYRIGLATLGASHKSHLWSVL